MKSTKRAAIFALFLVAFFGWAVFAKAGELLGGENFTLEGENTIEDNAYVSGGNINMLGNVVGDLVAAGGNIFVSGNVEEDVLVAGGSINFQGNALDDARMAGGNVSIGGDVAGDLAVAGGTVSIFSDSKIGKDLFAGGGTVEVNGEVAGRAQIAGGDVKINGKILGPVTVHADRLVLGEEAIIEGGLKYSSPGKAEISPSAQVHGEIDFQQMTSPKMDEDQLKAFFGIAFLVKLLAVLLAGVILILVFQGSSEKLVRNSIDGFVKEAVRGFVILVAIPVAALILMISLVGLPLGLLMGIFLAAAAVISCIFSGIVLGAWLSKMWFKKQESKVTWKNAVIGIVLLQVIGFIPVLGWLVGFILFLVVLGSFSLLAYEKFRA